MESDTLNDIMTSIFEQIKHLVYSEQKFPHELFQKHGFNSVRGLFPRNVMDMFPEFYAKGSTYYIIKSRAREYVEEGFKLGSYEAFIRGLEDANPLYTPDPLYLKRQMLEEFLEFLAYEMPLIVLKQPDIEQAFCQAGIFSNEHYHEKNAPDISLLFNALEELPDISELAAEPPDVIKSALSIYKDSMTPILEKNKYQLFLSSIHSSLATLLLENPDKLTKDPLIGRYHWTKFIAERAAHFLVYFLDLVHTVLRHNMSSVRLAPVVQDLMEVLETKLMDIFASFVHKRELYEKKTGYMRGLFRLMDAIGVDYGEYKSYMDTLEEWQAESIYEDINRRIAKLNEQIIIISPLRLIEHIDLTKQDEGTKAAILLERLLPRYANPAMLLEDVSDCILDCVSILGKFKNE